MNILNSYRYNSGTQYLGLPYGAILTESLTPSVDYYASPCILKSSSGRYIYSHDIFGSGADLKKTKIYYTDNLSSNSWTLADTFTDFIWGTLFEYSTDIYIIGVTDYPIGGVIKISKSTDDGETWSTPVQVLGIPSPYEGWTTAPINGVIKDGYYVKAFELRENTGGEGFAEFHHSVMVFADLTDLTDSANWSYSNIVDFDASDFQTANIFVSTPQSKRPPSAGQLNSKGFLEGGLVELDSGDLRLFLRLEQTPSSNHAVYLDVTWNAGTPTSSTLGSTHTFVDMVGGNVKFQILNDSVSGKLWSVVNTCRPKFYNDGRIEAFLISSDDDGATWVQHQKVLGYDFTADWESEVAQYAAQYSHFIIDGNDLLVVTRTADANADDWHNANLITLTRVKNFRSSTATTFVDGNLIIDENSVIYDDANGISLILDQSKYHNSIYNVVANNAFKPAWVAGAGMRFEGAEFLNIVYDRAILWDTGFTMYLVIKDCQSTGGQRIVSYAPTGSANDIVAGCFFIAPNGFGIENCYGTGYTDFSAGDDMILAVAYDSATNQLWFYKDGANRGNPPTKVNGTWSTDHMNKTSAITGGGFATLSLGRRAVGTPIYFDGDLQAIHMQPFTTSANVITYMDTLNAIYSIY